MINRLLNIPNNYSFFLFGARSTGKSTLISEHFAPLLEKSKALYLSLLDPEIYQNLSLKPGELFELIKSKKGLDWVILDEVQKIPALLDVVHALSNESKVKFALTGSSARKLKRGSANMLAGRAVVKNLFPFTHLELRSEFDLSKALDVGTLPGIYLQPERKTQIDILKSYAFTYLKQEIQEEQVVRKLDPFRLFLNVAAQSANTIINFSKIAEEAKASTVSVQNYFQILEDTLIGFLLNPFHRSIRKRQRQNPKFYFFDCGVQRALANSLNAPVEKGNYAYGRLFEQFIVNEIHRLNDLFSKDFSLSYFRTTGDCEIDLVIERPNLPLALVEIKSTDHVTERDISNLARLLPDFGKAEAFCLSMDKQARKIGFVTIYPWQEGIRAILG